MAKKTRIPELVVGKIYIDGGDKDKVYTIGADEDGALRIGDSRSNMVATIDQKTGKIVAGSFAGDGSALAGISAEGLAELQTAKLLTLSTDKLFFNFDADGVADPDPQIIALTAKVQNIDNPVYRWYIDSVEVTSTGETKTVGLTELGSKESIIVTVELDNESLSETVTLHKLQAGRTGRDAVVVSMSNPSVNYQADSEGNIDENDAALMAPGATSIVVRYGAQKLTPVTGAPVNDQFSVTVASSEYVIVPTVSSYIAPDTVNKKMDIGAPSNVIAAVGTISFSIVAQVNGETYNFTEIQTFNLSIRGATGEGAKFVKLTSDDYQIGYNSDGLTPDPAFVTLTADSQNHETTTYYRWFVDNVPWNPGITGSAISPTPDQHLYTTDFTMKLPADSSHTAFGSKQTIRVETQISGEADDPIASDGVSVIATKDGSNAIRITADNLSHGFPASSTGQIDASDYEDGAVTFQVYHGNENFTPNMTVTNNLKNLIQGTAVGTSADLSAITTYIQTLNEGEFTVLADATTATIDETQVNTIDPYAGAVPASVTDDTGVGVKFSPSNMQETLRRAAINYSFYLKTLDGQLAATTVRTQTFLKGRDGPQGPTGEGEPGTDAAAVKIILDDYQVGFDENGGNPQTATADGMITLKVNTQGHDEALTLFRVYKDDVVESVHNPQGDIWETYNWRKLTSGTPWYGTHVFDFSGDTYTDWTNRKKVIRVETTQLEYINAVLQDTSNLTVQTQDSTTIIATKEGSNAVEIFADNLSHQFIEDTSGIIDYIDGGINFGAFIGNTQLEASTESSIANFKASSETDSFYVSCEAVAQVNITKGGITRPDPTTLAFGAPSNFGKDDPNKSIASLTFTVSVKDSTGTVRPDRTFVQTLTRAKDGSDSKLIRIDGTSTVFAFADDWDWTADPSEIVFNISSQNLALGEEVTAADITFIDKDGVDVSTAVKNYVNPPDSNDAVKTNNELITAALQTGDSFSLRFAQLQGLAKDENGNTLVAGLYQNQSGETIETSSYALQQLKNNGFPLTVRVTKTGLAGAVQTISDETRLLSLLGGTNAIQIDAPNSIHLFDADADMVVNPNTLPAAGTDINVYVGASPLSYDSSGDTELQRGMYRFGDFQYGAKAGTGTAVNMLTLTVRNDKTGIDVSAVSHDYIKQTVTLPIEVCRTDGELFTRNLFLTYSKVKEGRDGENLKDRNFDFSQGPTGWSLDDTSTKGADLTSVQLTVDSDEDANFGGSVGVFHFYDSGNDTSNDMMAVLGKSKSLFISEALPVGATAEPASNVDDGTWLIKFRAKAVDDPNVSTYASTNMHNSPTRAWLFIKPFSGDGTPYSPVPAVDNTSPMFYFDVPSTAWAAATTVHGKLGFSTDDDAGYDYDDYSVPLLKDHYLTYVLRITPAEIQALMGTAASFKIGMRIKSPIVGTNNGPKIMVDAYQAEKLPYSGLEAFDPDRMAQIRNNTNAVVDVKNDKDQEKAGQVTEDMSTLTNYNFFTKYSNGFPAGLIPSIWTSDGSEDYSFDDNNFPTPDPTRIWYPEDATAVDGPAIQLVYNENKRHSLSFPALQIPAPNYKIRLKIRYKTSSTVIPATPWSEGTDNSGPLVRVYFSETLEEGKKYVTTKDTNYSFTGYDDVIQRRSGNNIVKTIRLDSGVTWDTDTTIITLDTAGIGSSFSHATGDLKYFSISLFPGSSTRDQDLYVDYVELEMLPPVTMTEFVGDDKGAKAEQWFSTDPTTERNATRTAAVTEVKADPEVSQWTSTTPADERVAAKDLTKADPAISPWVATTPAGERTTVKNDTFGDSRFTNVDTKATNAQSAASVADGKAVTAQSAASVADGKAVTAQSAASVADGKAVTAQSAANTAQEGVNLTKNNVEDLTKTKSTNVNGDFKILDEDELPLGVASYAIGSGHAEGFANNKILEMRDDDGDYLRIKNTAVNVRNGVLLPAVSVPENHYVEVTMEYRTNGTNTSDGQVYIRWTDIELASTYQYVGASDTDTWKTSARYSGTILEGESSGLDTEAQAIPDAAGWTEKTFKFPFDWDNQSPKYMSVAVTGYYNASSKPTDIKFINVNFKKNNYRSGTSYPSDLIPQNGDQFFLVTSTDDYGYLTTYGKNSIDFTVASNVPTGYSTLDSLWPAMVAAKWTRSSTDIRVASIPVITGYGGSMNDGFFDIVENQNYITTRNGSDKWAYFKRRFFGPFKATIHYTPLFRKTNGNWLRGEEAIDVMTDSSHDDNHVNSTISTTNIDTTFRYKLDGSTSWVNAKVMNKTSYGAADGVQTVEFSLADNDKGFDISLRLDGWGTDGGCFGVEKIEITAFSPTIDERTEYGLYELADQTEKTLSTFTGQHKCVVEGSDTNVDGLIVSSLGHYNNMNFENMEEQFKVTSQEAVPVVEVTKTEKDKKVLGVISSEWKEAAMNTRFLMDGFKEEYTKRFEINSLGEGGIWVSDATGFLENGDYICSSNIPGYGMKQDDDILRNYTVAKITQDCLFDLDSEDYDCKEVEHGGTIYKVAFVGCTYHCG